MTHAQFAIKVFAAMGIGLCFGVLCALVLAAFVKAGR